MKLPEKIAVMTLPNATLFPQAMLPLYIFEPRYRRMLADALEGDRMIAVAMQRPNCKTERPSSVAGLGLISAAVEHQDGTSHLILQGLARVELGPALRYQPYRLHTATVLVSPPCDRSVVGALVVQVRDLLAERFKLGLPFPFPVLSQASASEDAKPSQLAPQKILNYLDNLANLVSCAVLAGAHERQKILETPDIEVRLNHLVRFLLADLRRGKKE
jgi:Lon protease-like protein